MSAFPIVPQDAPGSPKSTIESAIREFPSASYRVISIEEYQRRLSAKHIESSPVLTSQSTQTPFTPSEKKRAGRRVRVRQQLGKLYKLINGSTGAQKRAYLAEARLIKQQEHKYRLEKQRARRGSMSASPIVQPNSLDVTPKPEIESAVEENINAGYLSISIEDNKRRLFSNSPSSTLVLDSQAPKISLETSGIKKHRRGRRVRVRQQLAMIYQLAGNSSGAAKRAYLAEARAIKKQEYEYRLKKQLSRHSGKEEKQRRSLKE